MPKVASVVFGAMVGAAVAVDESREAAAVMSRCQSKSMRCSEDDEKAEWSGD